MTAVKELIVILSEFVLISFIGAAKTLLYGIRRAESVPVKTRYSMICITLLLFFSLIHSDAEATVFETNTLDLSSFEMPFSCFLDSESNACFTDLKDIIGPQHRDFCENFAVDYFYRLTETAETVKVSSSDLSYDKKRWSTQGGLIAIAWAVSEAGWKLGYASKNNNYWGLGGTNHFMHFNSFKEAYSYKLLLMKYGKEFRPKTGHQGWPDFLEILESGREATTDEINKALRSGPYCSHRDGPYNYDKDPKTGKCINYAYQISKKAVKTVKKICGFVFEESTETCVKGPMPIKSYIYTTKELKNLPSKCKRMQFLKNALEDYSTD